jgi:hypothetical protein
VAVAETVTVTVPWTVAVAVAVAETVTVTVPWTVAVAVTVAETVCDGDDGCAGQGAVQDDQPR